MEPTFEHVSQHPCHLYQGGSSTCAKRLDKATGIEKHASWEVSWSQTLYCTTKASYFMYYGYTNSLHGGSRSNRLETKNRFLTVVRQLSIGRKVVRYLNKKYLNKSLVAKVLYSCQATRLQEQYYKGPLRISFHQQLYGGTAIPHTAGASFKLKATHTLVNQRNLAAKLA